MFPINSLIHNGVQSFSRFIRAGSWLCHRCDHWKCRGGRCICCQAVAIMPWPPSCGSFPGAWGGEGAVVLCCVQGLLKAFRSSYMQLSVGLSYESASCHPPGSVFECQLLVLFLGHYIVRLSSSFGFSCNLHTHFDEVLKPLCRCALPRCLRLQFCDYWLCEG